MKKENYQKFLKSFREYEPIDIAGEKMFVREIDVKRSEIYPNYITITFYLGAGSMLSFKIFNYDKSWDAFCE